MINHIGSLLEQRSFEHAVGQVMAYLRDVDMFENFEKEYIQSLKEQVVYELFVNIAPDTLRLLRKLYPSQHIVILGDSHVRPLFDAPHIYNGVGIHPTLLTISGASVAGFGKARSTLKIFPNLLKFIDVTKPRHMLLKLGQVDIECGYYYKKFVKDRTLEMESYVDRLVEQYVHAIQSLPVSTTYCACGINLPTLFDQEDATEYVCRVISKDLSTDQQNKCRDFLDSELPSISERTKHALMFNSKLKNAVSDVFIQYIDFTDIFYEKCSRRLRSEVSGEDQHYNCSESDIVKCANMLSIYTSSKEQR